ncbi:MAG: hypothetical protein ACYSUT_06605 [Planctomycetota bacterium]|jgi:hypothetical protein
MFKSTGRDQKTVWICLVFVFLAAGSLLAYNGERQRQPRQPRQRPQRDQAQTQQKQLSEEARAGFQNVQSTLKEILTAVNQNHRPESLKLDNAQQVLKDNKRHFRDYQDSQQAEYMLLQAWSSYYADDADTAMKWALKAAKIDDTKGDAWVSGAIFCMLHGKKPVLPRIPKAAPKRPRRNGDEYGMHETSRPTGPTIQKGTLDFDVLSLRPEFFSQRAELIDYQKMQGEPIEYALDSDTLCVMFWKSENVAVEETVPDANEPGQPAPPQQGMHDMLMMEMSSMSNSNSTKSLDQQRQYFKQMARVCKDQESLAFLQINADSPKQAKKVATEEVNENRISEELTAGTYVPMTFAAGHPDLAQCAPLVANGPLMLVVGPGGKLKYAGPADGFAAAFIVTALTDTAIDLQELNKTPQPSRMSRELKMTGRQADRPMEMGIRSPAQPTPAVDPNQVLDPNAPTTAPIEPVAAEPAKSAPAKPQAIEMTLEDCVKADKLLVEAQLHIDASRKLRGKSPEMGIIAARKVMADYPNTEYAEQAREWLRKVPYSYKDKFNITNEELGY